MSLKTFIALAIFLVSASSKAEDSLMTLQGGEDDRFSVLVKCPENYNDPTACKLVKLMINNKRVIFSKEQISKFYPYKIDFINKSAIVFFYAGQAAGICEKTCEKAFEINLVAGKIKPKYNMEKHIISCREPTCKSYPLLKIIEN